MGFCIMKNKLIPKKEYDINLFLNQKKEMKK